MWSVRTVTQSGDVAMSLAPGRFPQRRFRDQTPENDHHRARGGVSAEWVRVLLLHILPALLLTDHALLLLLLLDHPSQWLLHSLPALLDHALLLLLDHPIRDLDGTSVALDIQS